MNAFKLKKIRNIKAIEEECGMRNSSAGKLSKFSKTISKSSVDSILSYTTEENLECKNEDQDVEVSVDECDILSEEISKTDSNSNCSITTTERNIVETHSERQFNSRIESWFLDVGRISRGGIFGLGETMDHRIIMAETTVQCLVLPRYWLLERNQNPANMWQRHRIQLDITLPSRRKLFKEFLSSRRWQTFKKGIVSPFESTGSKLQDIPIMGRIISSDQ